MSLDELPIISIGTMNSFVQSNLKSSEDFQKFIDDMDKKLEKKDPGLWAYINKCAEESGDYNNVKKVSYTLYAFLESQIEADKMNSEFKNPE